MTAAQGTHGFRASGQLIGQLCHDLAGCLADGHPPGDTVVDVIHDIAATERRAFETIDAALPPLPSA